MQTLTTQDTTVVRYNADDNAAALDEAVRTAIQATITAVRTGEKRMKNEHLLRLRRV